MSDQSDTTTDAEKAAAEALAQAQAGATPPDPADPANQPPAEEPVAEEPTADAEPEPDPGMPTLEEATSKAEEAAQAVADAAAENRPEPEAEPEPEPVDDEETVYVVYKAVEGQAHPGRFLTVTVKVGEDEDGMSVWDTLVLEEGIPTEIKATRADALCQHAEDVPNYVIKQAS